MSTPCCHEFAHGKPHAAECLAPVDQLLALVRKEYSRAKSIYPNKFNSAHEGYAVMLEEMDELKDEVWRKQCNRDKDKMRAECIQIAAMAVQFALELT